MTEQDKEIIEQAQEAQRRIEGYSAADEIAKLATLRDSGKITAEEYEDMKKKAIAAGLTAPVVQAPASATDGGRAFCVSEGPAPTPRFETLLTVGRREYTRAHAHLPDVCRREPRRWPVLCCVWERAHRSL